MKYIQCPDIYTGTEKSIFLAGGITSCGDWQKDMVKLLSDTDLVVINPRRENFDVSDPGMTIQQIGWEHRHLNSASAVLFWFPPETLCPITLYELGARSMTTTPIFIGTDYDYKRNADVTIQTLLIRPEITVVHTIEKLAEQVKKWSKQ